MDDNFFIRAEDHLESISTSLRELISINRDMKVATTLTSQIAVDGNTKLMNVISLISSMTEKKNEILENTCSAYLAKNLTKIGK